MSEPLESLNGQPRGLDAIEREVVDVFVDGVKVLGLPRSIGEIYGLLFISQQPLSLDDLVVKLEISKGSASQGIRMLKGLGAVKEAVGEIDRRTYYRASVELKRLVGGFIREQIRPHLDSGKSKINLVAASARSIDDSGRRQFIEERLDRLSNWMRSGSRVLPILQKLLGQ